MPTMILFSEKFYNVCHGSYNEISYFTVTSEEIRAGEERPCRGKRRRRNPWSWRAMRRNSRSRPHRGSSWTAHPLNRQLCRIRTGSDLSIGLETAAHAPRTTRGHKAGRGVIFYRPIRYCIWRTLSVLRHMTLICSKTLDHFATVKINNYRKMIHPLSLKKYYLP